MGAARSLDQFPLITEQGLEVAVVPLDRIGSPGAFDSAADGVFALAGAEAVLPAEALFLDAGAFRLTPDILVGVVGAVRLAEG
jgi:hypothetical protein